MSKIILSGLEDPHFSESLTSGWLNMFREATKIFPEALVVTEEQAKKHFASVEGEIFTNFHGIPIEIEKSANEVETAIKLIDSILGSMHVAAIDSVTSVYRLLEEMKGRLK